MAFVLDEAESPRIAAFDVERPLKQPAGAGHASTTGAAARGKQNASPQQLDAADAEVASFEGFCSPWYKQLLFVLLGLASGGLLFLVAKWSLAVRTALRLRRCPLREATFVRTTMHDGRVSLDPVQVLQPPATASHPYLSAQHHPELLVESGYALQERLLEFRCGRYFYAEGGDTFLPVPDVPRGFNTQLQASASALAAAQDPRVLEEREWRLPERQQRYGTNEMAIPVKGIAALVADEMWHPFYVFQYFSVVIWVAGDQYYVYAVCIMLITWFSIVMSAVETHQNMRRLAELAHYTCTVEALRGGRFVALPSTALVPGDVVAVTTGVLPADCVLLTGECIVDENMLTGESVPVRKVPYCPSVGGGAYDPDKHASCTLYGGTLVAQARAPGKAYPGLGLSAEAAAGGCALAMVVRTRFFSAKGQLLRSILHPRESSESFIGDSLKFIAVMLVACMAIFVWAAVVLWRIGAPPGRIVVRFLDMVTIAVPPALPACLTIATVFSIGRLRRRGVYVTGPHTIALAGRLDAVCFDKTGTLTVQGLELQGIVPVANARFEPASADMQALPPSVPQLLASCHGLAWLGDVLVGDPLDQKLFAATGWTLVDSHHAHDDEAAAQQQQQHAELAVVHAPGQPQQPLRILRRFEFSSQLMRNLVVVQAGSSSSSSGGGAGPPPTAAAAAAEAAAVGDLLNAPEAAAAAGVDIAAAAARHMVFVKGSPEVIRDLVSPGSVPPDFDAVLGEYTREGLRVLALAQGRVAPSMLPESGLLAASQKELEAAVPLELVGLAVLANPLRPDSAGVITDLQQALIRTAMVTGDHVRTAISVAHHCNILPVGRPVLLVDGSSSGDSVSLSVLYPDGSINKRVSRSTVLAQVMMGELECAVTGKGFDALLVPPYDPELLQPVLRRGAVFARMSPDNKRDLMEVLGGGLQQQQPAAAAAAGPAAAGSSGGAATACPHLGLFVGFCGDGANDCGALKAAHVGVSLCEAEASVAAPMTSKQQSIAAMLHVVAEGRCALLATFQIFQFIVGYAMAQAFATNLMYTHALQMGNYQYLIQDLFYTTVLAALMGSTRPCASLARAKPPGRVLSPPLTVPLVMQLAVVIVFQLLVLSSLRRVPWYVSTIGTTDLHTYVAPETSVMYLTNLAQYVMLAVVFNKGSPHRQPLWTNWGLSAAMALQVAFILYSLFSVDAFTLRVQQIVGLSPPDGLPTSYRALLLGIMLVNAFAAGAALLLSTLLLRLAGHGGGGGAPWRWWRGDASAAAAGQQQQLQHRGNGDSAQQGLLAGTGSGGGLSAAAAAGLPAIQMSAVNAPSTQNGSGGGVHVPMLQAPSGAALL